MDALAEAQTGVSTALDKWKTDGLALMKGAKALGVETGGFTEPFSGSTAVRQPARAARSRAPAARRRTGGRNGAVSDERIVAWLAEHGPANQQQIAQALGTTRQTIGKKLAGMTAAGKVTRHGHTWHAGNGGGTGS